ncbi:MAG: MarR family transcriptional regulator [Rhizobiaceae bacterium]|nr:MarR family transcriptional regulator [Rhizobiaceae bacterium]
MTTPFDPMSPTSCVSFRLRRAARIVAKTYDAALKPVGLRNTQFTLLAALIMEGPQNIGQLSEALATDGTTLTRNLQVMSKRGLVEDASFHEDERVRIVKASQQGEAVFRQALPHWQMTQQKMLDVFGQERWSELADLLQLVESK